MKINFRLSSKMHLLIIISCVLIAIGLLVGTVCECVANGFFNYGEDYADYKCVTVTYENTDFSGTGEEPVDKIKEFCDEAFSGEGLKSYSVTVGDTETGGTVVYKFTSSTDSGKLDAAKSAINAKLAEFVKDNAANNSASVTNVEALLSGGWAMSMAAVAVSVSIVVHFIYFIIRYKFTMALGALLADVHNFALFLMLTAMCRIPVGSTIAAFAVLTVLITIIGTSFFFDKMRKNLKEEELKKLAAFEIVDKTADECFWTNTVMPACLAAVSVILFVLMSISSLSPLAIISPVLCSLLSFISCAYGTALFVPSVYSRFKLIGDEIRKNMRTKTVKSTEK